MDVEVILHGGKLKLLEIDARLPSQTPTVVYLSTGINMVEVVGNVYMRSLQDGHREQRPSQRATPRGVVYEHIKVTPGRLEVSGEHIMAVAGPLYLHPNFFGADEAISDYEPGRTGWVATLMTVEETRGSAWAKRCEVIEEIRSVNSIRTVLDPSPVASLRG
jgi:pyrrolysine biosynthesis protein PylC